MSSRLKNFSSGSKKHIAVNSDWTFGIAVSEWNDEITGKLLEGARQTLLENGISEENIFVKYVPGSFELPLAAQWMLGSVDNRLNFHAVICLGCVIQGETRHFEFICDAVAQGIKDVTLKYNKPVVFGILTTNNLQQAKARAGGKHGNKGIEAAITALKMVALKHELNK